MNRATLNRILFMGGLFSALVFISVIVFLTIPSNLHFVFGDATNFVGYSEAFSRDGYDFSLGSLNVLAVTLLYSDVFFSNALINGLLTFLIWAYFIIPNVRFDRLFFTGSLLVLLFGELIFRIGEPSREFLLLQILFAAGIVYNKKKVSEFYFLVIAMIIFRPVYMIIIPFLFLRSRYLYFLFFSTLCFFLRGWLEELDIFQFLFGRVNDYKGSFSGNLTAITFLNLFGGLNAFLGKGFDDFHANIFLLSYVFRCIIICFIWWFGGLSRLIALFCAAFSIGVLLGFPHPRYLEPYIFFVFGSVLTSRTLYHVR